MAGSGVVTLLNAAGATGPWVKFGVGGIFALSVDGTFASATASVQWKGPGGGTILSPGPDGVFLGSGGAVCDVGAGQEMRIALTNTQAGTSVNASMRQVHN